MHYFSEQHKHRKANPQDTEEANARRTVEGILPAAVIVALTTAVGFWTNAVTDVPALAQYSMICALAVLATFFISVAAFCLSAPLRIWGTRLLERTPLRVLVRVQDWLSNRAAAQSKLMTRALGGLADLHVNHSKKMLAGGLLVIGIVVAGAPRIGLGFDQLRNFDESEPVRIATQKMEDHVGGSTEMVVSIRTNEEDRFLDPQELRKLEALETFFRENVGADRVLSVAHLTRHMHRAFNNNEDAAYRLPDNKEQTAQLFALNSDTRLYEYITPGHQWVRIVGRVPSQNSHELSKKYQQLDHYLSTHFPAAAGYTAKAAGEHRVYAALTEGITGSLQKSLLLAFILIFGLLTLLFRSLNAGLLSVPPNIMPVVLNLGLMGWVGIRLSAENAIFATICIGIAVDDTVHFIQYMRARLNAHGGLSQAVRETILFKGPALIGTTLLMTAGFGVMLVSSYQQVENFGFVISCGVGAALFGDLILLPALILVTGSRLGVPAALPEARTRPTITSAGPAGVLATRERAASHA